MNEPDVVELLDIARTIAAEAAILAADMTRGGIRVRVTKSNDLETVTQADTADEALIRKRLAATRSHDGVLGEEGGEEEGTSGITWVIDPIDGTVNYLYGSPNYSISAWSDPLLSTSTASPKGALIPAAVLEGTARVTRESKHPPTQPTRPGSIAERQETERLGMTEKQRRNK